MEARVAAVDDLPVGTMRKVTVGETGCLLVRLADGFHAYPSACPHYHGPLAKGVLHEGRVVCPWHEAIYEAASGDLLDPPSFFGLPAYPVRVAGDDVFVEVPDAAPSQRTMPMTQPAEAPASRVVVVGAGAAAAAAVEALRQAGFDGRIVMIGPENRPPYDRPNCCKDLLAGTMPASWMPLRSPAFYEKHGVERRTGRVVAVNLVERAVTLDDDSVLSGDALLLAPGGVPRRLTAPGADRAGVFTLRTWEDVETIVAALEGARHAVIAGASFIGLEAAASLRHRGLDVTVVAPEPVPFARLFGDEVGGMVRALHEEHGVTFRLGRVVAALEGGGRLHGVRLDDGEELPADVVITGIGIVPATSFLTGLDLLEDGSVAVDERLRTAPGVWAAGDVATYPSAHIGERVRIEHWRLALQHGRCAGFDIAGRGTPFAAVPFFWTLQHDLRLGFAGYGGAWDRVVTAGDVAGRDFIAYFCRGDAIRGACGTRDRQVAAFSELMRCGRLPSAADVAERADMDLADLLG